MPAIVRQTMSRNLARDLLNDVIDSQNQYFIGIGKSDVFNEEDTVIDPQDSILDEKEFRRNLQSIKKVEGATFVARRYNWSSGSVYSGWSDSQEVTPYPTYVLNDAKEVYLCLETGVAETGEVNVSTIEPNYGTLGVDHTQHFRTGDGYVWKFLFSLTPENIYQHLSSNWIPVDQAEDSLAGGDAIEDLQFEVKEAAVGGQIIRGKIVNPGSGFTNQPTITIEGDGQGAAAVAYIHNGEISKVEMTSDGHGYTFATFIIQGDGVDAKIRAVITDNNGLGFDPVNDLKTSSVMFNIKPNGEEGGAFIVENSFRQMGLIKNPLTPTGLPYTGSATKVLPTLHLSDTAPFTAGKLLTGMTNPDAPATAYIDQIEDNVIHYHQNESTGFIPFTNSESVSQQGVVETGVIQTQQLQNGIDRTTGDVLYIENRYRIRRDAEQQEDIKIVITI